jgi:hypothetical protein
MRTPDAAPYHLLNSEWHDGQLNPSQCSLVAGLAYGNFQLRYSHREAPL